MPTTADKKKAPAATGAQDQNTNTHEGHLMNTIVDETTPKEKWRKKARARAALATRGTAAADERIKIIDSLSKKCVYVGSEASVAGRPLLDPHDVYTAEEIAEMPVVIRRSKRTAKIWRDSRGRWHRSAGGIGIQTLRDGRRGFLIWLDAGANRDDLDYLEHAVERVRRGRREPHEWMRSTASWADDRTLILLFAARPYEDPYLFEDYSPEMIQCTETLCKEEWHVGPDEPHMLEFLEGRLTERGSYEIEIRKHSDKPDSAWFLDFWTNGDLSEITPAQASKIANDLAWMSIECETTNAKEARTLRRHASVDEQLMGRDV